VLAAGTVAGALGWDTTGAAGGAALPLASAGKLLVGFAVSPPHALSCSAASENVHMSCRGTMILGAPRLSGGGRARSA